MKIERSYPRKIWITVIHSLFILCFFLMSANLQGQRLSREQIKDTINDMPAFSLYEDNYFISGVPLNKDITRQTADVKYQVSFRYLLSRNKFPWDSYLFLTYTQKAFWDIYDKSKPFQEINFKPGLNLGLPVFDKKDELLGMAFLKFEHESNGRDSIYSRSWNKIALAFHADLGKRHTLSGEVWWPFRYKKDNPDLPDYIGLGEVNYSFEIKPELWSFEIMAQKGLNWELKGALRTRILYSPFEMKSINFMAEWYYGYAESLIAFKELRSMIRVGFVMKSDDLNFL